MNPPTVLLAMLLAITSCFLEHGILSNQHKNGPQFTELSAEDTARLDKQRAVVAAVIRERYGTPSLTKTKSDMPVLQRLIDDHVFSKSQTYELQSVGVAFGDVLASQYPLRWVTVTDEFGTDPTLRYKDMVLQINALTMISKRIERNEQVDLAALLRITGEQLEHFEKEWKK